MTSKNPFEVRLEVLKMAQDMADKTYQESTQLAWSMVEKVTEYQNKNISDMQAYFLAIKPKMYSPQDVVTRANELYAFIISLPKNSQHA